MFFDEPPPFASILNTLTDLENRINDPIALVASEFDRDNSALNDLPERT
jgi:hypothetical protein